MLVVGACYAQTTPSATDNAYTDDNDGFGRLIGDVLQAAASHNTAEESALVNSLLMPPHSSWFIDTFGPAFGPRLSAAYDKARPEMPDQLRAIVEADVERGIPDPKIVRYDNPSTVDAPTADAIDTYLNCMNTILPLYDTGLVGLSGGRPSVRMVNMVRSGSQPAAPGRSRVIGGSLPGFFVFADGNFRFIPSSVLSLLPEWRPLRIRLDMDAMKSKVIQSAPWRFPQDAATRQFKGKVVVHLVVDTTGKVKETSPVEGPPALADSVAASLKEWTFQPTTLDGDPVEVDLTYEMNFGFPSSEK
jgi:hypothetical protein